MHTCIFTFLYRYLIREALFSQFGLRRLCQTIAAVRKVSRKATFKMWWEQKPTQSMRSTYKCCICMSKWQRLRSWLRTMSGSKKMLRYHHWLSIWGLAKDQLCLELHQMKPRSRCGYTSSGKNSPTPNPSGWHWVGKRLILFLVTIRWWINVMSSLTSSENLDQNTHQ